MGIRLGPVPGNLLSWVCILLLLVNISQSSLEEIYSSNQRSSNRVARDASNQVFFPITAHLNFQDVSRAINSPEEFTEKVSESDNKFKLEMATIPFSNIAKLAEPVKKFKTEGLLETIESGANFVNSLAKEGGNMQIEKATAHMDRKTLRDGLGFLMGSSQKLDSLKFFQNIQKQTIQFYSVPRKLEEIKTFQLSVQETITTFNELKNFFHTPKARSVRPVQTKKKEGNQMYDVQLTDKTSTIEEVDRLQEVESTSKSFEMQFKNSIGDQMTGPLVQQGLREFRQEGEEARISTLGTVVDETVEESNPDAGIEKFDARFIDQGHSLTSHFQRIHRPHQVEEDNEKLTLPLAVDSFNSSSKDFTVEGNLTYGPNTNGLLEEILLTNHLRRVVELEEDKVGEKKASASSNEVKSSLLKQPIGRFLHVKDIPLNNHLQRIYKQHKVEEENDKITLPRLFDHAEKQESIDVQFSNGDVGDVNGLSSVKKVHRKQGELKSTYMLSGDATEVKVFQLNDKVQNDINFKENIINNFLNSILDNSEVTVKQNVVTTTRSMTESFAKESKPIKVQDVEEVRNEAKEAFLEYLLNQSNIEAIEEIKGKTQDVGIDHEDGLDKIADSNKAKIEETSKVRNGYVGIGKIDKRRIVKTEGLKEKSEYVGIRKIDKRRIVKTEGLKEKSEYEDLDEPGEMRREEFSGKVSVKNHYQAVKNPADSRQQDDQPTVAPDNKSVLIIIKKDMVIVKSTPMISDEREVKTHRKVKLLMKQDGKVDPMLLFQQDGKIPNNLSHPVVQNSTEKSTMLTVKVEKNKSNKFSAVTDNVKDPLQEHYNLDLFLNKILDDYKLSDGEEFHLSDKDYATMADRIPPGTYSIPRIVNKTSRVKANKNGKQVAEEMSSFAVVTDKNVNQEKQDELDLFLDNVLASFSFIGEKVHVTDKDFAALVNPLPSATSDFTVLLTKSKTAIHKVNAVHNKKVMMVPSSIFNSIVEQDVNVEKMLEFEEMSEKFEEVTIRSTSIKPYISNAPNYFTNPINESSSTSSSLSYAELTTFQAQQKSLKMSTSTPSTTKNPKLKNSTGDENPVSVCKTVDPTTTIIEMSKPLPSHEASTVSLTKTGSTTASIGKGLVRSNSNAVKKINFQFPSHSSNEATTVTVRTVSTRARTGKSLVRTNSNAVKKSRFQFPSNKATTVALTRTGFTKASTGKSSVRIDSNAINKSRFQFPSFSVGPVTVKSETKEDISKPTFSSTNFHSFKTDAATPEDVSDRPDIAAMTSSGVFISAPFPNNEVEVESTTVDSVISSSTLNVGTFGSTTPKTKDLPRLSTFESKDDPPANVPEIRLSTLEVSTSFVTSNVNIELFQEETSTPTSLPSMMVLTPVAAVPSSFDSPSIDSSKEDSTFQDNSIKGHLFVSLHSSGTGSPLETEIKLNTTAFSYVDLLELPAPVESSVLPNYPAQVQTTFKHYPTFIPILAVPETGENVTMSTGKVEVSSSDNSFAPTTTSQPSSFTPVMSLKVSTTETVPLSEESTSDVLAMSIKLLKKLTMLSASEVNVEDLPEFLQTLFKQKLVPEVSTTRPQTTPPPNTLRTKNFKHKKLSSYYKNININEESVEQADTDLVEEKMDLLASLRNQLTKSALKDKKLKAKANHIPIFRPRKTLDKNEVKNFYKSSGLTDNNGVEVFAATQKEKLENELQDTLKWQLVRLQADIKDRKTKEKVVKENLELELADSLRSQLAKVLPSLSPSTPGRFFPSSKSPLDLVMDEMDDDQLRLSLEDQLRSLFAS